MPFYTQQLELPGTLVNMLAENASQAGVLGTLSPERPTVFGPVRGATFTFTPRAKIVGEGDTKPAGQDMTVETFTAPPIKLISQVRTSDEFMWADEDYRLSVIRDLVIPQLGASIGRGVDLIAFHGIDPATGAQATQVTKFLAQTTKAVQAAGTPTAELNSAVGLIANDGGMPDGIALDAAYGFGLATEVWPAGTALAGQPVYPTMGFGQAMTAWRGLNVAQSSTVSGRPEIAAASGVVGFVGDWSQVRWGFQRRITTEVIEYGDPDQTGRDLKAHNEVILRAEAVVYVAIGNLDRFVKINGATA